MTESGGSPLWGVVAGLAALLALLAVIWLVALRLSRPPPPLPRDDDDPVLRLERQMRRHPFLSLGLALAAGLLAGRSRGGESLLRSLAMILEDSLRRRPPP